MYSQENTESEPENSIDLTEETSDFSSSGEIESIDWLANNLQVFLFKTNLNGTILHINDYAWKTFGFSSAEEMCSKNVLSLYKNESDRNKFIELLTESNKVSSFETDMLTHSGEVKQVILSAVLNDGVISGMAIDHTEYNYTKDEIEKSLSLLRSTLESTTDGILVVNKDGSVGDYNQRFIKMWDIPTELAAKGNDEELLEFVLNQLKEPDKFIQKVQYLYDNPKEISSDLIEFKDGRIFERYSHPQINESQIIGRVWSFRDATEKIINKKKVDENALKFHTLYESANDAIFIMKGYKFIDCNSKTLQMFGCQKEDIIGKLPTAFSPEYQPDGSITAKTAVELLDEAYSGKAQFFEWKHCKKDGQLFDAEVSLNVFELSGEQYLQAIVRDITERKRAELLQDAIYKISQSNHFVQDLDHLFPVVHKIISNFINAKNFYIALYDSKNELLSFPYFVDEYDEKPDPQQLGNGLTEYIIRSEKPLLITPEVFQRLVDAGEVERILTDSIDWLGVPLKITDKTIGAIVVQTYSESFRYTDEDKEFLTYVSDQIAMAIDRTSSREELIKAKETAEEMNKLKTTFLANMSHELRTPMVGILGYTEILRQEIKDPELVEMAEEVNLSANRLLSTLDLILDLSKVEANKSDIHASLVNLGDSVISIVKSFENTANKKNVNLKVVIKDEQVYSFLDERILLSIVNNLVSNAIKFTERGTVSIEVDKNERYAFILVSDTGIGIPEESHELIFEEFRQVSEGLNRGFEGSGLGLSITKRFTELMDGNISVKSEVHKGSTFTVSFPLHKFEKQIVITSTNQNKAVNSSTGKKKILVDENLPHILLVEDDLSNAGVIEYILNGICNVEIVRSGEQALGRIKEKTYDVILMDIDLGRGMDGIETTKQIRELEDYNKTPIIAVTALAMKGQKELFLEQGCSHYISKPFDSKVFLRLIKSVLAT
ncbi:ATP-binding protein [Bacteroidota bacterium]